MKNVSKVALSLALFLGGASLALANISPAPGSPTTPQAQFGFFCNPYSAAFDEAGFYTPTGGTCTYELTSQETTQPNIFLGVYKGTVGSSELVSFDFGANFPESILQTSPNDWAGVQDDDFFSVAVGYTNFSDLLDQNNYFLSGGTSVLPYSIVEWKWGVPPPPPTTSPLTVTADSKTMPQGGPLPALTATLSGFVNGDTASSSDVTGSASCTTTATASSTAGNYPITCTLGTLASAGDYTFDTFVPGTLTVTPPPPPTDTQAPVIVITNPLKNGVYAKTDTVFLTANVTDASALATTTYWFGTKKINPAQSLPLSTVKTPSIQSVSVSAKDIYGNTSTTTVKFFVVKSKNSCLLDIIAILVLITQDHTFPDKPTLQNLIADCSALLKGGHHW